MTQPAPKPVAPIRLVVIGEGAVVVYDGRKKVAYDASGYEWTAPEIEELRTARYAQPTK